MTAFLVPEIWCDACSDHVVADAEETATGLRETLRSKGWLRVKRDGRYVDLCPPCSSKPQDPPRLVAAVVVDVRGEVL